jgi:hypothetical protein
MYTSARVGDIGPWPKSKAFAPFDQKWQAAIRRFSFLGISARDNSKQWAMRRVSQLLVLESSSRILLYQFLQPTIGGKGQFLKLSCHSWGFDSAALKGIFWDSASINSTGSETPTGPRKYDASWSSIGIKISAARAYQEQKGRNGKIKVEFEEGNTECVWGRWDLPWELGLDPPFEDWSLEKLKN